MNISFLDGYSTALACLTFLGKSPIPDHDSLIIPSIFILSTIALVGFPPIA